MDDIIKPGIYDMPAEQYHADPCPEPSLSASIATILSKRTAKQAWFAHPRLNKNVCPKNKDYFDFGRAMHAAVLEPEKDLIEQVMAEDWRTQDARAQKESLQAAGKIPMLFKQYDKVQNMASAAREFIASTKIGSDFFRGQKEATLIAHNDCWLRGRLDCISQDRASIFDYKTVLNAHPDEFINYTVFKYGYDIQAAMYLELNKLTGFKDYCTYYWILQEKEEPYCCSLVEASESVIECGRKKLMLAKHQWIKCLAANEWPSYGSEPFCLDAPSWEIANLEMLSC